MCPGKGVSNIHKYETGVSHPVRKLGQKKALTYPDIIFKY